MAVRGWVLGCVVQPRGSELTADVAAGGTVLPIEDPTDFDDDPGVIQINDELHTYGAGAVDEDASSITLDVGLTVAAQESDWVFTLAGGQSLTDAVLTVSCGDGDNIEVTVPFEQRDYWPEGDYDDPVPVTLSDDLERIETVNGRVPASIELAEVKAGYTGSLQDIYDKADAAAAAAAEAAANGTAALTAANGKNTNTYSSRAPVNGSDACQAGDNWFVRSGGIVSAQYAGLGNAQWQSVALTNIIVTYLDAGVIAAGTAFTNALSVKTNFTLGDATTDGVIQSYNFANSPVGVFINKNGLVAKGGSIAGANITGATLTGGTLQTALPGTFRLVLNTTSGAADIVWFNANGTRAAVLTADGSGMGFGSYNGVVGMISGMRFDAPDSSGDRALNMNGNPINNAREVLSGQLGMTSPGSTTNSANVQWFESSAQGYLRQVTSLSKFKLDQREITLEESAGLLSVTPKTWFDSNEVEENNGSTAGLRRIPGMVAEDVQEHAPIFSLYNPEGDLQGVAYDRVAAGLIVLVRDHHERIAALETENTALRDQLDDLTARLERLEAAQPQTGA